MLEEYIPNAMKLWQRYNIDGKTTETPKLITYDKCIAGKPPYNDTKGQPGFDRLCVILPQVISHIYIFPPVNGESSTLMSILEEIYMNKLHINPDAVILFAPPFYDTDSPSNKNLLANMLDLKLSPETNASIYVLAHSTTANKMLGCLQLGDSKTGYPIPNMLEPSYVIYPFAKMIKNEMVGSIVFSAACINEVNLPASNIRQISSVSGFLSSGKRGTIAFPPDITREDTYINKIADPYIFRFFGEKMQTFSNNFIRINLKQADDTEGREGMSQEYDVFIPTDEDHLVLDGVAYKQIDIPGQILSIRKPTPDVADNWNNYKFTKDETRLLEHLRITPSLMDIVFGRNGPDLLVDFLANMVNSNCYVDGDLLTNEECSSSEDFMDKIYGYLLQHDPRIEEGIIAKKEKEPKKDNSEYRVQQAEDDANAAEDELNRLKESMGIDKSVSLEALQKNAYEDPDLKPTDVDQPEIGMIFGEGERFYMFIIVEELFTQEDNLSAAMLYVDGPQDKVSEQVQLKINEMKKTYPGFRFYIDPEDLNHGVVEE